jgi:hypothetical protein
MLIPCGIGTEAYGLHSVRQKGEGADKDAELLVSRRDVAVPELRVEDEACFRPVSIQGLVSFEALVREEGVVLLRFHERGVHVEGSRIHRMPFLDGGAEVCIDAFKGQKEFSQRRDDCLALNTGMVLVKGGKVSEDSGGGRDRAMFFLAPSLFCFPLLLSRKILKLDAAEYAAEPFVGFQDAEIVNRLPSRKVEEDKGHDDLLIRPPLDLHMKMGCDTFAETKDGGEVEVNREAGKRGHATSRLLFFVVVGEWAL